MKPQQVAFALERTSAPSSANISQTYNQMSWKMGKSKLLLAAAVCAFLAGMFFMAYRGGDKKVLDPVSVAIADAPLVMHTSGGRLEVATVTVTEDFHLDDPLVFAGVDLGTTASNMQVQVVYRYYIDMAKEWPIKVSGDKAIVEAGAVRPQLPVAFRTDTMKRFTQAGWARFNKHENLEKLERAITPLLAARAPAYQRLTADAAKTSIKDFVRVWLLKNHKSEKGPIVDIEVVFPVATSVPKTK